MFVFLCARLYQKINIYVKTSDNITFKFNLRIISRLIYAKSSYVRHSVIKKNIEVNYEADFYAFICPVGNLGLR